MKQPRLAPAQGDSAIQVTEYVCGLLKPEERAQIHILLSRDDQALAQALAWEEELLALVDALPRVQPTAALRERLQRTLGIGPPPAFQPPPQPQLLRRPHREPGAVSQPRPQKPTAAAPPASSLKTEAPAQAPQPRPAESHTEKPAAPRSDKPAAKEPRTAVQRHEAAKDSGTVPADSTPPPPAVQPVKATVSGAAEEDSRPPHRDVGVEADGRQRVLVRKLWFWRLIGVCAAAAAIVGFMLPSEPPAPPVQIVKVAPTRAAILQAPGTTSTPGWTATLGPEGNLMMQPLVHTEVPTGSQVLLWTRSEQIPEPRLLGRINPNQPVQVPAAQLGALAEDQLLEITLETDEDAAKAVPNGPILFIGQMAVFGSEGAVGPAGPDAATGASAASGAITQ